MAFPQVARGAARWCPGWEFACEAGLEFTKELPSASAHECPAAVRHRCQVGAHFPPDYFPSSRIRSHCLLWLFCSLSSFQSLLKNTWGS